MIHGMVRYGMTYQKVERSLCASKRWNENALV